MGAVKLTSLVRNLDHIDGHGSSEKEEAEKTVAVELSDLASRSARGTVSACGAGLQSGTSFSADLYSQYFLAYS